MKKRLGPFVSAFLRRDPKLFLGDFARFASSSSILRASQLASSLVVAAVLGPANWGYWYLLNLIVAYGALTQLGALNGMSREVPFAFGAGKNERAVELRRSALGVVIMSTALAIVLLACASLSFLFLAIQRSWY